MNIAEINQRIDDVITQNRRTEFLYLALTVVLFATGICCLLKAILAGVYAWSIPSAFTTLFLYKPLNEIKELRRKNISLAIAPILITQLPTAQAAKEIQKLLQNLYGGK